MRKLKLMEAQEQKRASAALVFGREGKEATIDVVANLAMVPISNSAPHLDKGFRV